MVDDLSRNPYAEFDESRGGGVPAAIPAAPDAGPSTNDNPYAQFGPPAADETGPVGSFFHGLARAAAPALGSLPAIGAGAEAGAAVGGAVGGPFAEITAPVGGIIGGVAGALGAGSALSAAQNWAISKLPDSWQEALGQSDRQQKLDQEHQSIPSFLGGLAPYAITMNPFGAARGALPANATTLQRIMANPLLTRIFGGATVGGIEAGQEVASHETPDWRKVAISTAFGVVMNRPNALGQAIEDIGAAPVRGVTNAARLAGGLNEAEPRPAGAPTEAVAPETTTPGELPPEYPGVTFEGQEAPPLTIPRADRPTIAQAGDAKVMGPGITEGVYLGDEKQDPVAEMTAQEAARTEQATIGAPVPGPDLRETARTLAPDVFENYDRLIEQQTAIRTRIDQIRNPPDEDFSQLESQRQALEQELAGIPVTGAGRNLPEARRLRAQIRDFQSQIDELQARRDAFAAGEAQETPETAALRQHLQTLDHALMDAGPQVAAAYRRAAEALSTGRELGGETVPPNSAELPAAEPQQPQPQNVIPAAAAVPEAAKSGTFDRASIERQRAFIAKDVMQHLVAAGRPVEEAEAAGKLTSERYVTRSARLGGQAGSPQELYEREGPRIAGPAGRLTERTPAPQPAPKAEAAGQQRTKPANTGQPTTLRAFIRSLGGIRDEGGDLKAMDLPRGLVMDAGVSADRARAAAAEAGYLGPDTDKAVAETTVNDLFDALEKHPVYSIHDQDAALALAERRKARELAQRRVMTTAAAQRKIEAAVQFPEGATPDQTTMGLAAELMADGRETDPLAAWDRAAEETERAGTFAGTFESEGVQSFLQSARGTIRLAEGRRPVITLMAEANASTFIHESAHSFLEELLRDAEHPAAPGSLKDDATTVRDWLGLDSDSAPKTRQHEKFARGFEQYMREGIAPSAGLSHVFAQFKSWLTAIYQTVKSLGKPINDDIRRVFDRLLAEEPQHTLIAPERPGGPTLAEIHAADAAQTPPEEAEPAGRRVDAERMRAAEEPPREVADEVAKAVAEIEAERAAAADRAAGTEPAGEPAAGEPRRGEVEPGGSETGPVAGRSVVGGATGDVGESLRSPVAESSRASGGNRPNQLAPGPSEQFERGTSRFVDKAGNIRLDNLTTNEDVSLAIRDAAEANDDFIGDRRGVVTDGQVMDLADALGMTPDTLNRRKIGQAFNAEQVMAARKLLLQSATEVSQKMKAAAVGSDEDVLAYAEAKDRHQMIQAQVAGITAEAGRALRAFRSIAGDAQAQATDQFIKQATGKTLFQLKAEAQLGAQFDTPERVSKFMADSAKRSFGKGILEYWINGLISGIETHMTYGVGNALMGLWKAVPETGTASLISAARRAMGRQGERVYGGEVLAQLSGGAKGIVPAAAAAIDSIRTGSTTLLPGEKLSNVYGAHANAAIFNEATTLSDLTGKAYGLLQGIQDAFVSTGTLIKAGGDPKSPIAQLLYSDRGLLPNVSLKGVELPTGDILRAPSRFVGAEHSFFRSLNYSAEINGLAYRKAMSEGLTGTDLAQRIGELRANPTSEMMDQARAGATTTALMGQGGKITQKLSELINTDVKLPILGPTPILKFIDPFVHISSNIIGEGLGKRTPLGFLSPTIRADLLGKNGNIAQDMAQARMLVGSLFSLGVGGMAAMGYATGSGPMDPKQQAMWRLAGYQPYSIRIGDLWYDTHRMGPVGMLMGIAADLYDVAHGGTTHDMLGGAAALQHAVTQNILDESFMRGPADFMRAVTERNGGFGQYYIRSQLSSFVPFSVGMAQLARASDPYSRQARTVVDAIKQKVPGLSETLMPRRDIWGEPMPSSMTLGPRGLTAIYESRISSDPVNRAMLELGIGPGQPPQTIRNTHLSPEQYDDFQRLAGRMTKMRLDTIVNSPDWQRWPAITRHDVIQETFKQSREAARGMMMMKYPTLAASPTSARVARTQRDLARGQ